MQSCAIVIIAYSHLFRYIHKSFDAELCYVIIIVYASNQNSTLFMYGSVYILIKKKSHLVNIREYQFKNIGKYLLF